MTRHEAREQAFIIIFEKLFDSEAQTDSLIELGVDSGIFRQSEFTRTLVDSAEEHKADIDALITRFSVDWRPERLPKVSYAILLLSICEIVFLPDIPAGVSANEAVELAKKYATESDASFINGILGSVVKSL